MKKTLLVLIPLALIGVVVFLLMGPEEIEDTDITDDDQATKTTSDDGMVALGQKKKAVTGQKAGTPDDGKKVELTGDFKVRLETVADVNRRELRECEASVNRVFGNAVEEDNDDFFKDESNISSVLDDFEKLTLTPPSTGQLLQVLASNDAGSVSTDELAHMLRDIRPCAPFKKMTFIHNLMMGITKHGWSKDMQDKAKGSIYNYFEKELGGNTTVSELNMQAALLQTMASEGVLDKRFEERITNLKEDLEDSYDDLLDEADEFREKHDSDMPSYQIIQKEFKISGEYRKQLLDFVREIRGS